MKEPTVMPGYFPRPGIGARWTPNVASTLGLTSGVAWQSNGGPGAKHPARALPFTLEVPVPSVGGRVLSVSIYGVFALYAVPPAEPLGVVGATLQLCRGDRLLHSRDMVHGRHYSDASDVTALFRLNGDGTMLETVGQTQIDGGEYRVDRLVMEVPGGLGPDRVVFKDQGTAASFVVFDVVFDVETDAVCPFKGHGGQVALSEIGMVLRLRDRGKFDKALHQLAEGMRACGGDLDEARSLALTFLAAVVASLLETDAPKSVHKAVLAGARELESASGVQDAIDKTIGIVMGLTDGLLRRDSATGDLLIDQALKYVARNYSEEIDDRSMAQRLNLSTSHFRHLFREATSQPFHRYLVSVRLEKARELLLQTEGAVSEVASAVGFQSPAHFSRAFNKRFGVAPSALRAGRR